MTRPLRFTPAQTLRDLTPNPTLRPLFQFLADDKGVRKDHTLTVDKMLTATKHRIDRNDLVQLCRVLDQLGLCNFVAGRRGTPSRVMFYYTPVSIGKAALGVSDELVKIVQPTPIALVLSAPAGGHAKTDKFLVAPSKSGVTFTLPANASHSDAEALADYIRNEKYKQA